MSIQLPGALQEVLYLTGVHWPDIEEDDLRGIATLLDKFSGDMRDHRDGVTGQLLATGSTTSSQSFDALIAHWQGVASGPVEEALQTVGDISAGLKVVADIVVIAKVGFIAELSKLAAEIAAAEASVFGSVSIPGLIAMAKVILQRLIEQLESEAISKVTQQLFGSIVDEIEGGISGMVQKTMSSLSHA